MNVCLFDSDSESVNMWRALASSQGLRLDAFPVWSDAATIPNATQILVLDQSAVKTSFRRTIFDLCADRPVRLIVASGSRFAIQDVVELMNAGVLSVLEKPFSAETLREEFLNILPSVKRHRDAKLEYANLSGFFGSLTTKEQNVLNYVLEGVSNKEAAQQLQVSVRTVESRRAKLYRKFESKHVVELVRKMDRFDYLKQFFEARADDSDAAAPSPPFHVHRPHSAIESRVKNYVGESA